MAEGAKLFFLRHCLGINAGVSYLLALGGSRADVYEKSMSQHNKMNLESLVFPFPENKFSGIFSLCLKLFSCLVYV